MRNGRGGQGDADEVDNEKRVLMYRRPCRIVACGTMNSIMIEFADGQREIVSRRSVRRLAR